MNILDTINSQEDIKALDINQLNRLSDELREFLINSVSKTGGHLASNLGIVEITLALHKVFDFSKDKIIFDVGHQSYVHKILTGRKDKFDTLRTLNGISGFPKTSESEYDFFNTGHSSTSISAALGMARARELKKEDYSIIALFGDGALTGGMMFEAMNDAGRKNLPLILILNDNAMSISKNVGSVSAHLRDIRTSNKYLKSKAVIEHFLNKIPLIGIQTSKMIKTVKRAVRRTVLTSTIFDALGFDYLGPIDGHNIETLIECLEHAKKSKKPIVLHVNTTKGKGYIHAEENPAKFHGIGKFDAETGAVNETDDCYSNCFGKKICDIAQSNQNVVAITAAMPYGTGLYDFSKKYPERFFDVGIAEGHAITLAAGMATNGLVPVVPIYSSFLQRAYDQILHDICLQNLHVVIPIDRAGIVGADGETHQGLYDISFLSHMPNMTLLSPSSYKMFEEMLDYAVNEHNGPIAIRYPRGNTQYIKDTHFEPIKAVKHSDGKLLSIFATGRMVKTASMLPELLGMECDIIELPTIKPLDMDSIIKSVLKTAAVVTIEDGTKIGGIGQQISAILTENQINAKLCSFTFPDIPIKHGAPAEIDALYGLDAESIAKKIKEQIIK